MSKQSGLTGSSFPAERINEKGGQKTRELRMRAEGKVRREAREEGAEKRQQLSEDVAENEENKGRRRREVKRQESSDYL